MSAIIAFLIIALVPAADAFAMVPPEEKEKSAKTEEINFVPIVKKSLQPKVYFEISSAKGWKVEGLTDWDLFMGLIRALVRPGEKLDIRKLEHAPKR